MFIVNISTSNSVHFANCTYFIHLSSYRDCSTTPRSGTESPSTFCHEDAFGITGSRLGLWTGTRFPTRDALCSLSRFAAFTVVRAGLTLIPHSSDTYDTYAAPLTWPLSFSDNLSE